LSWDDQAVLFDVAAGDLADLLWNAGPAGAQCLDNDLSLPAAVDPLPAPDADEARYYLVRGQNVCGEGSYGYSSGGIERSTAAACP
jgi:hypothetical protein